MMMVPRFFLVEIFLEMMSFAAAGAGAVAEYDGVFVSFNAVMIDVAVSLNFSLTEFHSCVCNESSTSCSFVAGEDKILRYYNKSSILLPDNYISQYVCNMSESRYKGENIVTFWFMYCERQRSSYTCPKCAKLYLNSSVPNCDLPCVGVLCHQCQNFTISQDTNSVFQSEVCFPVSDRPGTSGEYFTGLFYLVGLLFPLGLIGVCLYRQCHGHRTSKLQADSTAEFVNARVLSDSNLSARDVVHDSRTEDLNTRGTDRYWEIDPVTEVSYELVEVDTDNNYCSGGDNLGTEVSMTSIDYSVTGILKCVDAVSEAPLSITYSKLNERKPAKHHPYDILPTLDEKVELSLPCSSLTSSGHHESVQYAIVKPKAERPAMTECHTQSKNP